MSWDGLHVMGWSVSSTLPSSGLSHGAETAWQQEIWKTLKDVGEKAEGHRRGWKVGKGEKRLMFPPRLHYSQSDRSAHEGFTPGWC